MPIAVFWMLQMKKITKIYLAAVFSLGWLYAPTAISPPRFIVF